MLWHGNKENATVRPSKRQSTSRDTMALRFFFSTCRLVFLESINILNLKNVTLCKNRRAFLLHCNNKEDIFRRINLLTHLGPAAYDQIQYIMVNDVLFVFTQHSTDVLCATLHHSLQIRQPHPSLRLQTLLVVFFEKRQKERNQIKSNQIKSNHAISYS